MIRRLDSDNLLQASKALRRVHTIQRPLEQHVDVLETMTPHEFNAFRDGLNPASGSASAQFRKIEFSCGLTKSNYLQFLEPTNPERARLERRLAQPTLYEHLKDVLERRGFAIGTPEFMIASLPLANERGAGSPKNRSWRSHRRQPRACANALAGSSTIRGSSATPWVHRR